MPVTVDAIRAALRRERDTRIGSREKFEEISGLDASTIYRAEQDETTFFGIDTFVKFVAALPGLTFTDFFAQLEGLQINQALLDTTPSTKPMRSPIDVEVDHGRPLSSPDAVVLAELRAFVKHLASVLAAAADTHPTTDGSLSSAPSPETRDGKISDRLR